MERAIRAIAFDLEGPLVDFEKWHFQAHLEAAKQLLGIKITYDWIITHIPYAIGGGDEVICTGIARHHDQAERNYELLTLKRKLFSEMTSSQRIVPREGALELVEWLWRNHYTVHVGSNTPRDEAFRYLRQIGMFEMIEARHVVLMSDVRGEKKPKPDIYLETARRAGVSPASQLGFEDSAAGLEALASAGSHSIATPLHFGQTAMADVMRWGPRRIIHNLLEINVPVMMEGIQRELAS